MALLQGLRRALFLMSEVPLYVPVGYWAADRYSERLQTLQGNLADKKTPTPQEPQAWAYGRVLGGCIFL